MVDNDRGQSFDTNRYDQRDHNTIFDDEDVVEDVNSIQEPYPSNDERNDVIFDKEVEDPDENHEYNEDDHPHQYQPPVANVDLNVPESSKPNTFVERNPLDSTIPVSGSDR